MATSTAAGSSATGETKVDLVKKVRMHEVAVAELGHLPPSRPLYQKNGNLFFRTSIEKATASEQKQLHSAKSKLAKLEKLNFS